MAIRIKRVDGTYKTKVIYFVPAPGGNGASEELTFMAEFKRLTQPEVKELRDSGKPDLELVNGVMVGWEATEVGTSEKIPFSAEVVTQVATEYPGFAACVMLRFLETVGASRQKN